jgi:hypothetical protein
MHQVLTRQGFSSFFEPLADGDVGDAIEIAQLDHLAG